MQEWKTLLPQILVLSGKSKSMLTFCLEIQAGACNTLLYRFLSLVLHAIHSLSQPPQLSSLSRYLTPPTLTVAVPPVPWPPWTFTHIPMCLS